VFNHPDLTRLLGEFANLQESNQLTPSKVKHLLTINTIQTQTENDKPPRQQQESMQLAELDERKIVQSYKQALENNQTDPVAPSEKYFSKK